MSHAPVDDGNGYCDVCNLPTRHPSHVPEPVVAAAPPPAATTTAPESVWDLPGDMTLGEARQWLSDRVDDGVRCPCCTQLAKVYRRKVNAGMVKSMTAMYRAGGTDWVHLPTQVGARSREEGKLAYWDLVQEERVLRPDGGRAGWWRLTSKGVEFMFGRVRIPKYALIYDDRVQGFDGPLVGVRDALGTKFDYRDLMGGL